MTLPGFTAKASLHNATARYTRYGMAAEAPQPLVSLAAYTAKPSRYACHSVCYDYPYFCIVVCGPLRSPDADSAV